MLGAESKQPALLEVTPSDEQGGPEVAQVIEATQSAFGQPKVVTSGMLSLSRVGGITLERASIEKTVREFVTILRQILPPNPLMRLFVVDDHPRFRDSVRRLLMVEGMLVAFAANGQDALDLLRSDTDFDLVLSDLAMPVLDGASLCRALTEAFPSLPVVLMTGQAL